MRFFALVEELRLALTVVAPYYNSAWLRQMLGLNVQNEICAGWLEHAADVATGLRMATYPPRSAISKQGRNTREKSL